MKALKAGVVRINGVRVMIWRFLMRIVMSMSCVFLLCAVTGAQNVSEFKSGVVRIVNNRNADIGTGFIIRIDGMQAYIVTAAHVVRGDQHPSIYLFNQQHDALQADVLDMEEDDAKGLGLLRLKIPSRLTTGITALRLGPSSQIDGGEDVKVIGFPDGTEFWTVGSGSVARIHGRNLVFSGAIRGGNSGGPVISNRAVIGMVTDVTQASAYAARAEAIEPYLRGTIPNLIDVIDATRRPSNGFCNTLNETLDESKNGFYGIVGTPTSSENTFYPKVMMPEASVGYVTPPKRVYYYLMSDKNKGAVESKFFAVVTNVRGCSTKWQEKEESDSSYRFHKFRKTEGGVVVTVYYNPVAQHDTYFLIIDVAVPDERRREW
jgi:hypothetical protein